MLDDTNRTGEMIQTLGLGWYDTTRVLMVVWKVMCKRASTLVE